MLIDFLGPSLDKGCLPAVFYFALSAQESLHLAPINQPAQDLAHPNRRIFSMTLPGHQGKNPNEAIAFWTDQFHQGIDPISPFVDTVIETIEQFISKGIIDKNNLFLMGLSRGAFIACHVAAKIPHPPKGILGFAPLTQLDRISNTPMAASLNLSHLVSPLSKIKTRFYIGNHDLRVGTRHAFHFIESLAQHAYQKGRLSCPAELIISPSVGKDGHGTPPEIFRSGTDWLSSL